MIDFGKINEILIAASNDGRDRLLEHEGYELLKHLGAGHAPAFHFCIDPCDLKPEDISHIDGKQVVLKIQSPLIAHKTEAGGVVFVPNDLDSIRKSIEGMLDNAPDTYAEWLYETHQSFPNMLEDISPDLMRFQLRSSIKGVLITECIRPDSRRFGAELLVGLQWTREFGPVLTAGLGGIDAEMFAERFRGKAAVVTASPLMTGAKEFLDLFSNTTAYHSISGQIRGRERIIKDTDLEACFGALIDLGRNIGDKGGELVTKELEINPYVISHGRMVPLDMFCTFGPVDPPPVSRPVRKIENLLKPKSAGVIGVSGKGMNIGRIILRNLIRAGFPTDKLAIVKPGDDKIDGIECFDSISSLPCKLDLLVLAVSANQVPDLCKEIIREDSAESVILIPGGMGEKEGSEELAAEVEAMIRDAHLTKDGGPVFVGGNCLGILSVPGGYDTLFTPPEKLPQPEESTPVAFVSQSGAFMITRMSNQAIKPVYAISYGNQTDLTVSDYIHYLKDDPEVVVLAVYVEGFKDIDGLRFAEEVRDARSKGKEVIFYKAGRTMEGRTATSGHTASIAGDYKVCDAILDQAGALVAETFDDFEDLVELAWAFHDYEIKGNRVFGTSNAGYESVGMADSIVGKGYKLQMAKFSRETKEKIAKILEDGKLSQLVDIKAPMDLNPMASDEVHMKVVETLMADDNSDAIIFSAVPMTGMMQTLPPGKSEHDSIDHEGSVPNRLRKMGRLPKPLIVVIDSGAIYDPMVERIRVLGIPTFRSADRAMSILGRYITYRLKGAPG